MAKRLASQVVIYTDGADDLKEQLVLNLGSDPKISVDARPIVRLEKGKSTESEVIVHLKDTEAVAEGFLVRNNLFLAALCAPLLETCEILSIGGGWRIGMPTMLLIC